jgi:hypothetical protein
MYIDDIYLCISAATRGESPSVKLLLSTQLNILPNICPETRVPIVCWVVAMVQVFVLQLRPFHQERCTQFLTPERLQKESEIDISASDQKKWFTPCHNSINLMTFGTLRYAHSNFHTYLNQHQWFPSHPQDVITVECNAMECKEQIPFT